MSHPLGKEIASFANKFTHEKRDISTNTISGHGEMQALAPIASKRKRLTYLDNGKGKNEYSRDMPNTSGGSSTEAIYTDDDSDKVTRNDDPPQYPLINAAQPVGAIGSPPQTSPIYATEQILATPPETTGAQCLTTLMPKGMHETTDIGQELQTPHTATQNAIMLDTGAGNRLPELTSVACTTLMDNIDETDGLCPPHLALTNKPVTGKEKGVL